MMSASIMPPFMPVINLRFFYCPATMYACCGVIDASVGGLCGKIKFNIRTLLQLEIFLAVTRDLTHTTRKNNCRYAIGEYQMAKLLA
jgi:hypothetical protein